jgi:hypothetical protein
MTTPADNDKEQSELERNGGRMSMFESAKARAAHLVTPADNLPELDLESLKRQAEGALFFRTSNGFEFLGKPEEYRRWIEAGSGSYALHTDAAATILALLDRLRKAERTDNERFNEWSERYAQRLKELGALTIALEARITALERVREAAVKHEMALGAVFARLDVAGWRGLKASAMAWQQELRAALSSLDEKP